MNKNVPLQVVVETTEFIKTSKKCMDEKVKESFVTFIANHPEAGESAS